MTAEMTLLEYREKLARAADRKSKRTEKGLALGLRKPRKRRLDARKMEFARLKNLCRHYALSRAKRRKFGSCEVGIICLGLSSATLAYHIFPAATGNAIKYDTRNLLGACAACNGAEYFDRKRGSYVRWDDCHKRILGLALWEELKAAAGRKKISTVEAREMADEIQAKIERGEYA